MFNFLKPRKGGIQYIVAGLGNPGPKYAETRHNVGFWCVDILAKQHNVTLDRLKFRALTADTTIGEIRVLLMKPQTFMNLSGESIRAAAQFYKIPAQHILVLSDDISLPPGKLRVRRKGSDGGHNGLKNIIMHLDSEDFPRIKIGVGAKPHPEYDLAKWVTSSFSKEEKILVEQAVRYGAQAAELIVCGNVDKAMNQFN